MTIIQADRDAAAPFAVGHGYLANGRDYSGDYMVRNGHWDDKPLVQAFAAHREAAEARAREEAEPFAWIADAIERGDHRSNDDAE